MRLLVILAGLGVVLGLSACNAPAPQASAPPTPGSVAVTPSNFTLPEGSGCGDRIARYRAIQDNDLSMGHVAKSGYTQIARQIAAAESACAAGRDAQAQSLITASQQRHGYPVE
jgi:hypothetical protein